MQCLRTMSWLQQRERWPVLLAAKAVVRARVREADGMEASTTSITTMSKFMPLGTKEQGTGKNPALNLDT